MNLNHDYKIERYAYGFYLNYSQGLRYTDRHKRGFKVYRFTIRKWADATKLMKRNDLRETEFPLYPETFKIFKREVLRLMEGENH